jgi:septal ring factor EnvC (AmiA/AmiB activator)
MIVCFQLAIIANALAPLVKVREEAAVARAECLSHNDKLKEKKRETSTLEQQTKYTKTEVGFLMKELNTTLRDLSAERLCSMGFARLCRQTL